MMAGWSAIVYTRKKKSASVYTGKKIYDSYFLDILMMVVYFHNDEAIKMGGKTSIFVNVRVSKSSYSLLCQIGS